MLQRTQGSGERLVRWDPVVQSRCTSCLCLTVQQCRVLKGARQSDFGECVATYSGRLAVARVFIGQQQQHSSVKLFS